MKPNWLESKAVSILFLCSGIVFSCFCVYIFFLAIPGVPQFLNSSLAKNLFVILFAALAVMAIPSMLVIFFGMAVFCVRCDHSSIGRKALWFASFLVTGPIGSTVYYFTVYRGYIKRKRAADTDAASLIRP